MYEKKGVTYYFRIHVDNQVVISAFRNHRGRNPKINDILKRLTNWQILHNCRIDIVYVASLKNDADGPSRHIDHYDDEVCIR